jgi:hypothetical protein
MLVVTNVKGRATPNLGTGSSHCSPSTLAKILINGGYFNPESHSIAKLNRMRSILSFFVAGKAGIGQGFSTG